MTLVRVLIRIRDATVRPWRVVCAGINFLFDGLSLRDKVFVVSTLVLQAAALILLVRLGGCQDPAIVVNLVAVALLAASVLISLIRVERNNWLWPLILLLAGICIWSMSVAIGPQGFGEFQKLITATLTGKCPAPM